MKQEITNEFRADAIMAYPNARMILEKSGRIIECKGVAIYQDDVLLYSKERIWYHSCWPFKLLLKPLSKISDEDAMMCSGIIGEEIPDDYDLSSEEAKQAVKVFGQTLQKNLHKDDGGVTPRLLDFLRSRGYDCGYQNIPSLVEAGIAILETE